jgi:hypothetical protein
VGKRSEVQPVVAFEVVEGMEQGEEGRSGMEDVSEEEGEDKMEEEEEEDEEEEGVEELAGDGEGQEEATMELADTTQTEGT